MRDNVARQTSQGLKRYSVTSFLLNTKNYFNSHLTFRRVGKKQTVFYLSMLSRRTPETEIYHGQIVLTSFSFNLRRKKDETEHVQCVMPNFFAKGEESVAKWFKESVRIATLPEGKSSQHVIATSNYKRRK